MKKFRGIFLKNDAEIALMREANRIVALILDSMAEEIRPGAPTRRFEEIARDLCRTHSVRPAFLGYNGFPFALCCSVNEQVVHGFPSERRLVEGDIVSFDMGVVYEGFFGDSARTYPVGQVSAEARRLLDVTERSLYAGISRVRPGASLYEVSRAVQETAEAAGFGVVRRFVGHGVGRKLHEKPEVPNFVPAGAGEGVTLKAGMVLAIEPMITLGGHDVEVLADNWTAVTKDRSLSAHFEHSVAVTAGGSEILSLSPARKGAGVAA